MNERRANPHSRQQHQPLIINRGPERGLCLIWFGLSCQEGTRAPPHTGVIKPATQSASPAPRAHLLARQRDGQWVGGEFSLLHRGSESGPSPGPREADPQPPARDRQCQLQSSHDRLSAHPTQGFTSQKLIFCLLKAVTSTCSGTHPQPLPLH